jgi:hypothetical protein
MELFLLSLCEQSIKGARKFGRVVEIKGLNQERIRAKMISLVHITDMVRTRKHDNAQLKEFRLVTNPSQNLEAIHPWHFDV